MDIGRKNKESFWPSYVDIMTTLFAVMLILFAVSYARFKLKESQLEILVQEYKDIIDVYSTVDEIDKSQYFRYDSLYLKHTITISIGYQDGEYDIHKLKLDEQNKFAQANAKRDSIKKAGFLAQQVIRDLESQNNISKNIKFLVVIEGQSSKIPFKDPKEPDWKNNETLSFKRAQYLKKYWTDPIEKGGCGLFQKRSENDISSKCEIIVAGSGEGGVPRYYYTGDERTYSLNPANAKFKNFEEAKASPEYYQWQNVEFENQRFLINIIPIIGNIDVTKSQLDKIK